MTEEKVKVAEAEFEEYRKFLFQEITKLVNYIKLYRHLHECQEDRLDEMNMAPAFFGTAMDALFTVIVLWVDKLCDASSERGLVNFLRHVENNLEIFGIKELQRRREYPDDHWFLRQRMKEPIAFQTIETDLGRIKNNKSLPNIKLRRDKFHAHFDKDFFFKRIKFSEEAPITWRELDEIKELVAEIANKYSAAYDGNTQAFELLNITDVDIILNVLHKHKKRAALKIKNNEVL